MNKLRWVRGLTELLWDGQCPLCQRSTSSEFCEDCQRQVKQCQKPKGEQFQAGQLAVFAWGSYKGALKRSLTVLKYDNQPQLARPLAHWLGEAWLAANQPTNGLTVVPIPIHSSKLENRGYNQAGVLAERFCEFTRLPLVQGLERSQETTAQFKLSAIEREQNLAAAFSLGKDFRHSPPSQPVLLLDDIYTSGATARSAAQTLRRHGIRVYGMAVIARAIKEIDDSK